MNQPNAPATEPNFTPNMPTPVGISQDAVQAAIGQTVALLKGGREFDTNNLRSNNADKPIEQAALQIADQLGPQNLAGPSAQQPQFYQHPQPQQTQTPQVEALMQQVLTPEARALLAGQPPAQVPANAVTTPTPQPPAAPAPQPSPTDHALQQLAASMQQQAALQQQQFQYQIQLQQQQELARAQAQAQSWRDPAARQRALEQAGLNPDDPSATFMYETYHQAQDKIGALEAMIAQQNQQMQQIMQQFSGLQRSAQTITLQSEVQQYAARELAAAPEPARNAVAQSALALIQAGMPPQQAFEQAAAPLRAMLAAGGRPAPTAPQVPPAVTAGIALRGSAAPTQQGLVPQPIQQGALPRFTPNSHGGLNATLANLDQLVARGLLNR